jgi:uncharacterized protein YhaN
MRRTVVVSAAIVLSVAALVLQLLSMFSARKEREQLTETLHRLQDSLASVRQELDSLKKQAPGLGEYMSTIQLHTAKLWFAGEAGNWKLARYEHDELKETIVAAEALHARKRRVDISAVLQSLRETQLQLIEQAIARRDRRGFESAYSLTLATCNGCHRPAGYEFIRIIVPTREPVTNQQWKSDSPAQDMNTHP